MSDSDMRDRTPDVAALIRATRARTLSRSFPRKREPRGDKFSAVHFEFWIPAYAGMSGVWGVRALR